MTRVHSKELSLSTSGRSTSEITRAVAEVVAEAGVVGGLCNVFVHHTSASLMICENADPSVQGDMEAFMTRLVPDGDSIYRHTAEGPDDMPAHVRSVLTQTSISIPISSGRLALGTWQGLYLWEHRHAPHRRRVTVTIVGSGD